MDLKLLGSSRICGKRNVDGNQTILVWHAFVSKRRHIRDMGPELEALVTFFGPHKSAMNQLFRFPFFSLSSLLLGLLVGICLVSAIFSPFAAFASKQKDTLTSPEQMEDSLEHALDNYRAELESLREQLREFENARDQVQGEINAYVAQNTADSQLMFKPSARVESLENAIKNNRLASRALTEHIDTFQNQFNAISVLVRQTEDRIELGNAQIADIQNSQLSDTWKQSLESSTRTAIEVLNEKKLLGEKLIEIAEHLLDSMKVALQAKKMIGEKLATRLETEKKTSIFKRFAPLRSLNARAAQGELQFLRSRIESYFDPEAWNVRWMEIRMGGFDQWAVFFTALTLIFALQSRGRTVIRRMENKSGETVFYYRGLALHLLRRSFPILGLTVFLAFYSSLRFSLLDIDFARLLLSICLVLLLSRWGLDYLEFVASGPPTALRSFVSSHLKRFFRIYRTVLVVVLILALLAGRDSMTMWIARGLISTVFLGWTAAFWIGIRRLTTEPRRDGRALPKPTRIGWIKAWTYLVIGGTMFLNLIGYRILGGLWFVAWNKTAAILFWAWLGLNVAREWKEDLRADTEQEKEYTHTSGFHVRWSLIQLFRAFCVFVPAACILQFWDPSGFLRECTARFFNFTVDMGSLHLSVSGVLLAAAILVATRFAVRIGRTLLKEKILDKQSLERGLKDSITTIADYLGWGLGLILALGILGVNATSLAVVFGALSIGIGFGLQTIFNNFISGLILLFERPIQVGDILEINGLRAEVKKINVRATVVQSTDNTSVIIPNSELVSKQVTNLSFKDKRIRRDIEVGVAYGSDTVQVRDTLIEIAMETRDVLKFPKPNVIFADHAASALIFRLRVWVHVDHYWSVPSQIRFEIDRRFRQLGIGIAFPQLDLHVRTTPPRDAPSSLDGNTGLAGTDVKAG